MTCGKTLGISLSLGGWGCEGKRPIGLTLGISLSLGGWGCEGKRPIGLTMIPTPLESWRS